MREGLFFGEEMMNNAKKLNKMLDMRIHICDNSYRNNRN